MSRVVSTLILGAWVVLLGSHVRREYFSPRLDRLADAALALNPGTSFYTLRMGERAVGQASSSLDTVPGGFRLDDVLTLELPALGQTGRALARSRVELDPSLQMRTFDFSLDSEVGRFQARGEVLGDTLLRVEVSSQGSSQELSFRVASPPVFAAAVPIRVAMAGELEVGNRVRMPVFDPSTLATRTVEVRVLEQGTVIVPDSADIDVATGRWTVATYDTVPAWRIAEVFGGVSVESWVDDDGRVLRAESPLGFAMEKTEFELARQSLGDARDSGTLATDEGVILATAIQSDADLFDAPRFDELRFVLSGVELDGFDLEGGRQSLRGDTLVVRRERWDDLDPGYALPYPRMDLREALQPEPLIQSADPRIVAAAEGLARRGFGRVTDPRRMARELTDAVHGMLAKEITFSVPSALQVLETRRGDCNEHTVLYVALARALGLPARTAVGLVHLDGSFFYHAWPEVWLGEWVAVDPTFGQAPADATHLRFVVGGLAQQVELVRLIGRLDIDVVEIPRAD